MNRREIYNCAQCFLEFSTEDELLGHLKVCIKFKRHLQCPTCGKMLSSKRTYKAHVSHHSSISPPYSCSECSKGFRNKHALKAHVKLHDPKREFFFCDLCGTKYSTSYKLAHHFVKGCTKAKNKECPICRIKDTEVKILSHFKSSHNIDIEVENFKLSNIQQFEAWKERIESETCSRFVVKNKERKRCYVHYECHRNGYFKRNGTKRQVKKRGTNKINAFCPAKIWTKIGDEIQVNYVKTHVGHDLEPERLSLPKSDRVKIAKKIVAKIPFDEILAEYPAQNNKRIPKRKDLQNITARCGIKWDKNPKLINTKILENKNILRFKHINDSDVVLIVMSDNQMDKLKQFGNDVMCVTCIHNMNFFNETYFLISVLVLEGETVHPCLFMLCNRISTEFCQMLFSVVKVAVSGCRILMTDVSEHYYEGWIAVMAAPEKRLFTPWDANKMEKTSEVDETLKEITNTQDEDCLAVVIAKMTEDRPSEDFKLFGSCFTTILAKDAVKRYLGPNIDIILEKTCISLKNKYGVANSISKAASNLIRLTKEKETKEAKKIKDMIKVRHRESKNLAGYQVLHDNNNWLVPTSEENDNMYYIVSSSNSECRCNLRCEECNLCVHSFDCSCPDSSNMCSHIHFVKTIMSELITEGPEETAKNVCTVVCENVSEVSVENTNNSIILGKNMDLENSKSPLQKEKESLIHKLSSIISSLSSMDELEEAKEHLRNLMSSLKS